MNRAQVINAIAREIGAKSYLEIGVQTGKTFRAVEIAHKVGVDPDPQWSDQTHLMGSDQYFSQNNQSFDIIFVDGLHHSEQVYKDITNSISILNDGGVILVDDCAPKKEIYQRRSPAAINWTGDVWRAWLKLRARLVDWNTCTYDIEFGLGMLHKRSSVKEVISKEEREELLIRSEGSYKEFSASFDQLLNMKTAFDFSESWV